MIFNTYGDIKAPSVILMHGMCQHWKSMYELMHKLEEKYYLIIPGMDGFYEDANDFTTFTDQCRQIEEYVKENHNGQLNAKPEIANNKTKLWLCCGSKEPYAKKSHKMLMKYIAPIDVIILEGYGHGEMFYKHGDKLCDLIVRSWEGK